MSCILNFKEFEKYIVDSRCNNGSIHYLFKFDNGYGASVVQNPYRFSGLHDLWELAALRFDDTGGYYLSCGNGGGGCGCRRMI